MLLDFNLTNLILGTVIQGYYSRNDEGYSFTNFPFS